MILSKIEWGMRCWLAAWANAPSDAWYLRNDMRTGLVRELSRAGIATHLSRHQIAERRDAA